MMIDFLQKLTKRKTEVALKGATRWQQLVGSVLDGKEQDEDRVLAELDRLGKTTDDLAKAVELLRQRREWAKEADDGAKAEADLNNATDELERLEDELAKLLERHEAKLVPVENKKQLAIQRINQADSARRRLVETASDPILLQSVHDADASMAGLRQEQAAFERVRQAKSHALENLSQQDPAEYQHQADQLTASLAATPVTRNEFNERAKTLAAESEAARAQLLRPEAI